MAPRQSVDFDRTIPQDKLEAMNYWRSQELYLLRILSPDTEDPSVRQTYDKIQVSPSRDLVPVTYRVTCHRKPSAVSSRKDLLSTRPGSNFNLRRGCRPFTARCAVREAVQLQRRRANFLPDRGQFAHIEALVRSLGDKAVCPRLVQSGALRAPAR